MQDIEIHNKFKKTMIDRYGCEYAQESEEIREKTKNTLMLNYGVEYPFYSEDIKTTISNSFVFVNGIRVSKGQVAIAKYFHGSLNTNILGYFADIVIIEKKIIIEYNGSGHDLSVKAGRISETDFLLKENKRIDDFIEDGWKCLIVENPNDKKMTKKRLNEIDIIINNFNDDIKTIHHNIQ